MAAFNPFAPQEPQGPRAPQLQGIQAPNVPLQQNKPGMMQQMLPTVAEKAMGSDEAGAIKDWGFGKAKEAWSAFNPVSPDVIPVSELSNTMGTAISPSAMLGGGAEGAIAAQQAATVAPAVQAGLGLASEAATVATVAPAAGPFAPLVLLGAGLMAANSGK